MSSTAAANRQHRPQQQHQPQQPNSTAASATTAPKPTASAAASASASRSVAVNNNSRSTTSASVSSNTASSAINPALIDIKPNISQSQPSIGPIIPPYQYNRRIFPDPPGPDTFRILVSTDNHLGYNESDPVRRDDSFNSFEEILQAAIVNQVDFVLLGGDLFHDNKPSRQCLYRTVNLLRQYIYGDRPVSFELVSNPTINFPSTGLPNYLDSDVNVKLPIFSIHGNHDDPAGVGGYSTMDLLHSAKLVNYFGKSERVSPIINYPILLNKGASKLALYGLGNIRDERLHRTFSSNEVKWVRPEESINDWFNLLVLHQNRIKHSMHEKNYIAEKMLPTFLDIVIWGHEHECELESSSADSENSEMDFTVIQPGSSVATSLSAGESVNKNVAIIEIQGENYRLLPVPLLTTRPFLMEDVRLSDHLDPAEANTDITIIEEYLTERIELLLNRIKSDNKFNNPERPQLPLIRLRVEHTGFPRINSARFGQKFVSKLANPDDLLSFHKQRLTTGRKAADGSIIHNPDTELLTSRIIDNSTGDDDTDSAPPIHDLVSEILSASNNSLNLLSEQQLAEAVQEFVDKKDLSSITGFVTQQLAAMQVQLKSDKSLQSKLINPEDIERTVKQIHHNQTAIELQNKPKSNNQNRIQAQLRESGVNDKDPFAVTLADIGMDSDADAAEENQNNNNNPRSAATATASNSVRGRSAPARGRGGRGGRGGSSSTSARTNNSRRSKRESADSDSADDLSDDSYDPSSSRNSSPAAGGRKKPTISSTSNRSKKSTTAQSVYDEFDSIDNDSAIQPPAAKKSKAATTTSAAIKREPKATALTGIAAVVAARSKKPAPQLNLAAAGAANNSRQPQITGFLDLTEDIDEEMQPQTQAPAPAQSRSNRPPVKR